MMMNHIHGIIVIVDDGRGTAEVANDKVFEMSRRAPTEQFGKPVAGFIPTMIRSYKSAVSLRINLIRGTNGVPVCQRNYYEHIIHNKEDYQMKCYYILNNPKNCESDDDNQKW